MCERGQTVEVIIDDKSISVDACLAEEINTINNDPFTRTLGCCCGHGKYEPTIVVWDLAYGDHFEWFSGMEIPRSRNLYYKDSEGMFHLPERSCLPIARPTKPSASGAVKPAKGDS